MLDNIENFINKITGGYLKFIDYYGFLSPYTCLVSFYHQNFFGKNRNFDISLFHTNIYRNFYFYKVDFGIGKRICFGIGIISCYFDYKIK